MRCVGQSRLTGFGVLLRDQTDDGEPHWQSVPSIKHYARKLCPLFCDALNLVRVQALRRTSPVV
jgi:hypothetical protein